MSPSLTPSAPRRGLGIVICPFRWSLTNVFINMYKVNIPEVGNPDNPLKCTRCIEAVKCVEVLLSHSVRSGEGAKTRSPYPAPLASSRQSRYASSLQGSGKRVEHSLSPAQWSSLEMVGTEWLSNSPLPSSPCRAFCLDFVRRGHQCMEFIYGRPRANAETLPQRFYTCEESGERHEIEVLTGSLRQY